MWKRLQSCLSFSWQRRSRDNRVANRVTILGSCLVMRTNKKKRHDSTMLNQSGLLSDLRQVAFYNGEPLCLYGDPAYPLGVHLQGPYRNPNISPQQMQYNQAMSEVRVSVKWLFGNITNYFKFIDFKRQMKLNLSAVGKMYVVCALLENAHTCLYSNLVSEKFDLQPPSLQEYFWD